jgi:hypothetical protein
MEIALTGATGFVGARMNSWLQQNGHAVRALSRRPATYQWDPLKGPAPSMAFDAVIHLAGEPVAQKWTPDVKKAIRASRVLGTQHLIQGISTTRNRPRVLVCASATGFYGDRGDEVLTEESSPGDGFLANTCVEWEKTADLAKALGMRVVKVRLGVVLGPGGGALQKMLPPFRLGVGGPLAGGKQWMSWIHREDLVRLLFLCAESDAMDEAVNGVSPSPVTNREFSRALGAVLGRPAFWPVPRLAVEALYGEMAQVVLASQRVLPKAAEFAGFEYRFAEVRAALREILAS